MIWEVAVWVGVFEHVAMFRAAGMLLFRIFWVGDDDHGRLIACLAVARGVVADVEAARLSWHSLFCRLNVHSLSLFRSMVVWDANPVQSTITIIKSQ